MASPLYFFFGEETYPAHEFIEKWLQDMSSDPDQTPDVERFDLKEQSWPEILDSARTMPLLFSSQRLIVVQAPGRKKPHVPSSFETLEDHEKKMIRDYFASPSPGTVMVLIFPGKIKPFNDIVRFFGSVGNTIQLRECKPYRDSQLFPWIQNRLREKGKSIEADATARLVELTGHDLGILDQELEKIAIYMGRKSRIELAHVNEISGWGKEFAEYDIKNELEDGSCRKSILVIDRLLEKGSTHPSQIVNQIAGFMHDILLAKLRLREGKKDRKAIFREIYPQIKESYGNLYRKKYDHLFAAADRLSFEQIRELVMQLRRVDLKIKSTGLSFQPLIDEWIYSYTKRLSRHS
jgi:DNA polymerase III delta subunit